MFVDEVRASGSAWRVFNDTSTRTLVYVWGRDYPRGTILNSPFQPGKLMTVASRVASIGRFSESVDLESDLQRAFGAEGWRAHRYWRLS